MKKRNIILIVFLLLSAICGTLFLADRYLIQVKYTPSVFTEDTRVLSNPYIGYLNMKGYYLSDTNPITADQLAGVDSENPDTRLQMLQINLSDYRDCPISDSGLEQLDAIFEAWSANNKQLIVRFLYDWNGKAKETEPSDLSRILEHMDQVAPVVNRHTDRIYILQGIFVGNCGEMNNSNFMDKVSLCTLARHLAEVTDESIYLSVRTPQHWRIINNLMDCPDPFPAFSGELPSRIGLFNDGMLGSGNDFGTYGETPRQDAEDPSYKGTREDELNFQQALCNYVPNGGEVVIESPFNDLDNAISDLSRMHVSYLSGAFSTEPFQKWENTTYTGNDCFYGCSGLEYISAHLGYRYVLRNASLSFDAWRSHYASLSVTLENVGFAGSLKAFPAALTLVHMETGECTSIDIDFDSRLLTSGSSMELKAKLPVRELARGSYQVCLRLTDPADGEPILFANTLDCEENGYPLGAFTVSGLFWNR